MCNQQLNLQKLTKQNLLFTNEPKLLINRTFYKLVRRINKKNEEQLRYEQ